MKYFILLAVLCLANTEDTERNTPRNSAIIVASKFSLSQYAVEGMDYVMDYRLYNIGDKVASFY